MRFAAATATAATPTPFSCWNCATSAPTSRRPTIQRRPATSPSSSTSARRASSSTWKRPSTGWPTRCCNWPGRRCGWNDRDGRRSSSAASRCASSAWLNYWLGAASPSAASPAWARRHWLRPWPAIGPPRLPSGTPSCRASTTICPAFSSPWAFSSSSGRPRRCGCNSWPTRGRCATPANCCPFCAPTWRSCSPMGRCSASTRSICCARPTAKRARPPTRNC